MRIRHLVKITLLIISLLCSPLIYATEAGSTPDSTTCRHNVPTSCILDDDAIATSVEAHLGQDQRLRGLTITVSSDEGIVTLDGYVRSQAQANIAVDIAKAVNGVKEVRSNLNISTSKYDY